MANRERQSVDSAFAVDRATSQTQHNAPVESVRPSRATSARGNRPTESPSTSLQHIANGKSVLRVETSVTHQCRKPLVCWGGAWRRQIACEVARVSLVFT